MVERFNRSLLQMLRTYVEREWALFAYRSAVHSSTGVSPFVMMFGRQPKLPSFTSSLAFDSTTYKKHLCAKFAQLQDFVHANLVDAGLHQKTGYDSHSLSQHFDVGDTIWLSIPTAGKLDPHWEGKRRIQSIKSFVNVEITDGSRVRVVHINRIRHRHQPDTAETPPPNKETEVSSGWNPPQIDHTFQSNEDITAEIDQDATLENQEQTRYPM